MTRPVTTTVDPDLGIGFPWRPFDTNPETDLVIAAVCYSYAIERDALLGPSRVYTLRRPRRAAVWVLRSLGYSWPQIGRAVDRHHTSAMKTHEAALAAADTDPAFRAELDTILLGLQQMQLDQEDER